MLGKQRLQIYIYIYIYILVDGNDFSFIHAYSYARFNNSLLLYVHSRILSALNADLTTACLCFKEKC